MLVKPVCSGVRLYLASWAVAVSVTNEKHYEYAWNRVGYLFHQGVCIDRSHRLSMMFTAKKAKTNFTRNATQYTVYTSDDTLLGISPTQEETQAAIECDQSAHHHDENCCLVFTLTVVIHDEFTVANE